MHLAPQSSFRPGTQQHLGRIRRQPYEATVLPRPPIGGILRPLHTAEAPRHILSGRDAACVAACPPFA